jgi:RNA polymerase sigma-70 factor (ECF subfamily)
MKATIATSLRPRYGLAAAQTLHEDAHVSDDADRSRAHVVASPAPRSEPRTLTVAGESDLGAYVAIARAARPTVELDRGELAAYVLARSTQALPPVDHAGDLLLACACLRGHPTAISAFHLTYGSVIRRVLARRNASAADIADATQMVYERLLVWQADRAPLLSEYGGRGPLRVWISTAAARTLLTMRRSDGRRRANEGASSHAIGTIASAINPELMYFKRLYKQEIETAVGRSLDGLEVHARALLQLHLGERLSIDQLGKTVGLRAFVCCVMSRADRNCYVNYAPLSRVTLATILWPSAPSLPRCDGTRFMRGSSESITFSKSGLPSRMSAQVSSAWLPHPLMISAGGSPRRRRSMSRWRQRAFGLSSRISPSSSWRPMRVPPYFAYRRATALLRGSGRCPSCGRESLRRPARPGCPSGS